MVGCLHPIAPTGPPKRWTGIDREHRCVRIESVKRLSWPASHGVLGRPPLGTSYRTGLYQAPGSGVSAAVLFSAAAAREHDGPQDSIRPAPDHSLLCRAMNEGTATPRRKARSSLFRARHTTTTPAGRCSPAQPVTARRHPVQTKKRQPMKLPCMLQECPKSAT